VLCTWWERCSTPTRVLGVFFSGRGVVLCPRPVLWRLLLRAGRIPAHFLRQQQQLIHLRLLERLVLLFLLLERLLVVLYLAGASVKFTLADQLLLLLLHVGVY